MVPSKVNLIQGLMPYQSLIVPAFKFQPRHLLLDSIKGIKYLVFKKGLKKSE